MTHAEWLACNTPVAMLTSLRSQMSERKVLLFGCACCRRIWDLLGEPCSRSAVEVAEQFADGQVGQSERIAAYAAAAREA